MMPFKTLTLKYSRWKRKRTLRIIRQVFEHFGAPLDVFSNEEIENGTVEMARIMKKCCLTAQELNMSMFYMVKQTGYSCDNLMQSFKKEQTKCTCSDSIHPPIKNFTCPVHKTEEN